MNSEQELNEQDYVSVSRIDGESELAEEKSEYGIFAFLADMPIFGIEKPIYDEPAEPVQEVTEHRRAIEIHPRDTSAFYDFVYMLGLQVIRRMRKIGGFIKSLFSSPLHAVAVFGGILLVFFDKIVMKSYHKAVQDFKKHRSEVMAYFVKLRSEVTGTPGNKLKKLCDYFVASLKKHNHFAKTALNVAMPLAAFVVLICTVGHWTGSTYALEVVIDNSGEECSLGYISDESVFIEARSIVKQRIDSGVKGESELIANPTYKITRVKLNQLSDAAAISDKLIESGESRLTSACGVYIDGDFICSVKNETDARSVFNAMLQEEEEKYKLKADDENSFADFVEKVEFVQGLYPDDTSSMWEASKLRDTLRNEKKSAAVYYTVADGDTPSGVAQKFGISTSALMALNPSVNFNIFKTGEELMISQEVSFVRVKIIRIIKKNVSTPFETETIETDKLYKGDKRVARKGVEGTDKVTYLCTFINGVQTGSEEIDRVTLIEPTNEKVQVGTKSGGYGGYGNYQVVVKGKFAWPVSGAYMVTSKFGYRSRGYHKGIDISGSGANGKPIIAAESGTVELVKSSHSGYGNQVVINHGNGIKTRYAHMLDNSITVSVGQKVTRGQAIGRLGNTGNSTGPHLHFEVIVNGTQVNPWSYIG